MTRLTTERYLTGQVICPKQQLQIQYCYYFVFSQKYWCSMFEESLVYKLIKNSGFPFIVRHDRSIYKTQEHVIDPAFISRRIVFASIAGYFVGKWMGNRETLLFFGFGTAALLWHVAVDLKLKSQGKYQEIYNPPLFGEQNVNRESPTTQVKTQLMPKATGTFRLKPELRNLQVTKINKLLDILPKEYFK